MYVRRGIVVAYKRTTRSCRAHAPSIPSGEGYCRRLPKDHRESPRDSFIGVSIAGIRSELIHSGLYHWPVLQDEPVYRCCRGKLLLPKGIMTVSQGSKAQDMSPWFSSGLSTGIHRCSGISTDQTGRAILLPIARWHDCGAESHCLAHLCLHESIDDEF